MNSFKRAWLSVIRKPVKSLIVFSVILIISSVLIASSGISSSARLQSQDISGGKLTGFKLRNPPTNDLYSPYGIGRIPEKIIDEISKIKNITRVNRRMVSIVNVSGAKTIKTDYRNEFDEETERLYGQVLIVTGETDTSLDNPFRTGSISLVRGKHIQPNDKGSAIVHEDFAKANHLDIGSTFSLKANPKIEENIYRSQNEVKVRIIGIFKGKNQQMVTSQQELNSNLVYTDLDTASKLNAYPKGKETYHDASFFS